MRRHQLYNTLFVWNSLQDKRVSAYHCSLVPQVLCVCHVIIMQVSWTQQTFLYLWIIIEYVCSDSLNPYQNTMCCVGGKCTERKELSYHVGIDFCWNRIQTWLGSGFFDSFFLWSTQPLNLLFIHVFYHMIVTLCIMIMSCSILCELGKLTRHLPTHDSDRNERILTRFSHFLDKTLLYRSISLYKCNGVGLNQRHLLVWLHAYIILVIQSGSCTRTSSYET